MKIHDVVTGGNHTVMVTVESLGLASGDFLFTYDVTILSITPNNGSIAGKCIYHGQISLQLERISQKKMAKNEGLPNDLQSLLDITQVYTFRPKVLPNRSNPGVGLSMAILQINVFALFLKLFFLCCFCVLSCMCLSRLTTRKVINSFIVFFEKKTLLLSITGGVTEWLLYYNIIYKIINIIII